MKENLTIAFYYGIKYNPATALFTVDNPPIALYYGIGYDNSPGIPIIFKMHAFFLV